MIASINPANGETLRIFEALTDAQIQDKIARADRAYANLRQTSFAERARWLVAAAEILESEEDQETPWVNVEVLPSLKFPTAVICSVFPCWRFVFCGPTVIDVS